MVGGSQGQWRRGVEQIERQRRGSLTSGFHLELGCKDGRQVLPQDELQG